MSATTEWTGGGKNVGGPTHYHRARIGGVEFAVGDCALVNAGPLQPPYVCRILSLFVDVGGVNSADVQWFHTRDDLTGSDGIVKRKNRERVGAFLGDIKAKQNEVFAGYRQNVSTLCLSNRCIIKLYGSEEKIPHQMKGNEFNCRYIFDSGLLRFSKLQPVVVQRRELKRVKDSCLFAERVKEEEKGAKGRPQSDGTRRRSVKKRVLEEDSVSEDEATQKRNCKGATRRSGRRTVVSEESSANEDDLELESSDKGTETSSGGERESVGEDQSSEEDSEGVRKKIDFEESSSSEDGMSGESEGKTDDRVAAAIAASSRTKRGIDDPKRRRKDEADVVASIRSPKKKSRLVLPEQSSDEEKDGRKEHVVEKLSEALPKKRERGRARKDRAVELPVEEVMVSSESGTNGEGEEEWRFAGTGSDSESISSTSEEIFDEKGPIRRGGIANRRSATLLSSQWKDEENGDDDYEDENDGDFSVPSRRRVTTRSHRNDDTPFARVKEQVLLAAKMMEKLYSDVERCREVIWDLQNSVTDLERPQKS
eukprot:m.170260 g.170260  ORF g.170260 m.170260 type:complete len:538 (+) comp39035_c0_seq5:41-1654(+)